MTLLVVGSQRVDAGKTTFSTGLIARTGAIGFKPRAGNDYWFDQDDVREAVLDDRLYGKDARRLAAASPGSLLPEDINPVHRLWRPDPGNGSGLLGQSDRSFVVDRVGDCFVVNGTVEIPALAREHLSLSDAAVVESIDAFNQLMRRHYVPRLEALSRRISTTDRAIVESYSDVARPVRGIEPDAVAVVEPTRARIYEGSRYRKCCAIATGAEGSFTGELEERVSSVIDLADPVATVDLPALSSAERSDPEKVATAYDTAYEELIDTAGW